MYCTNFLLQRNLMEEKLKLLNEIKDLWSSNSIEEFDISIELLDYLEVKDLEELKFKILKSLSTLSDEQKEWLQKFIKE